MHLMRGPILNWIYNFMCILHMKATLSLEGQVPKYLVTHTVQHLYRKHVLILLFAQDMRNLSPATVLPFPLLSKAENQQTSSPCPYWCTGKFHPIILLWNSKAQLPLSSTEAQTGLLCSQQHNHICVSYCKHWSQHSGFSIAVSYH